MIEKGFAATRGPITYGEDLRMLGPNDVLLMYENGLGVVAVGRVLERWDEKIHSEPLYYVPNESGLDREYRIKVEWFLDLSKDPITASQLKKSIGWISSQAVQKIVTAKANVEKLVEERRMAASRLADDLTKILQQPISTTMKEALVSARVGQGVFRTRVLQNWGNRCAVSGSITMAAIRASHIKPWRDSTDDQRLDPNNGLPLIANLDALFDAGLITFETSGKIAISPLMNASEVHLFKLDQLSLSKIPTPQTAAFLEYHGENHFKK